MKQVVFDRAGNVIVDEVPAPDVTSGTVLIRVAHSVISTGTETVAYGKGGVASEVVGNPQLISRVLDQVQSVGVRGTIDQVKASLNERSPRGYCGSGTVVKVGAGITDLRPGDRVAYGGEPHAEFVVAKRTLVARVPDDVALDLAAITTLGSIALHGLRLSEVSLGESVVVIGLGLVGQLAVAQARAAGLRVAGADLVGSRIELARQLGLELGIDPSDPTAAERAVLAWTDGVGADAAIICAGTASSAPSELAALLCRDRGSVVMVGAAGMNLERRAFFRKELRFRVSRSYGPGRYDRAYEEQGHDYPVGYVRWTENRNFQAFLEMLRSGSVDPSPLLQTRYPVAEATAAYACLKAGPEAPLTAILDFPPTGAEPRADIDAPPARSVQLKSPAPKRTGELRIGLIGCGSFARSQIIPALRRGSRARISAVSAATGVSAANVARLVDADYCTTDYEKLLADDSLDAVVISTRHGLHHPIAIAAARAGVPFHVEKPLAIETEHCREIVDAVAAAGIPATVGFNRRSAPFVKRLRGWLAGRVSPVQILIRVNANPVPPDHWTLDPAEGGGRLVGEGCHFIDLASYLVGRPGRVVGAAAVPGATEGERESNTTLTIAYEDGSVATLCYVSAGNRSLPKERIEVAWEGRSVVIDDFVRLEAYGGGKSEKLRTVDKGIRNHFANFLAALRGETELTAPVTAGLDVAQRIDEAKALLRGQSV